MDVDHGGAVRLLVGSVFVAVGLQYIYIFFSAKSIYLQNNNRFIDEKGIVNFVTPCILITKYGHVSSTIAVLQFHAGIDSTGYLLTKIFQIYLFSYLSDTF